MVGVVIIERLHSVNTLLAHQLRGLAVGDAARGIGRSVRPVGADGEDERVRKSLNAERCGERDLLIAPAEALSPQVDDRFAAHEERKVFPVTRMRARNGSKHAPRLARLTAEAIGEDHRLVAERFARRGGRRAELAHAAGDLRFDIFERLRRLLCQKRPRPLRQAQAVPFRNIERLRTA